MNNKTNNNPYGHLLDAYLVPEHLDWKTKQQREKEEKDKYGNLLDKAESGPSIWENIRKVCETTERIKQEQKEEENMFSVRLKERIERDRREEAEHNAKVAAYAESLLNKKREEEEAKAKAEKQRRMEAEKKRETLDHIRRLTDMSNFAKKSSEEIKGILAYQKEKDEEHKKKMEWYNQQQEYMKN